jgi:GxxExxY protein
MLLPSWLAIGSTPKKTAPPVVSNRKVLNALSKHVIGSALTVSRTLGAGLPDIIYENARAYELRKSGLTVAQQKALALYYEGAIVGDYTTDLLVENTILLELTGSRCGNAIDTALCFKYLKATGYQLCMVLNFGRTRPGIKRVCNRA